MAREPQHLKTATAYLAENGETRMTDLANGIGISVGTLYSGLASAIARGDIVKRNEGRSVFYRLPGQDALERRPAPAAPGVEGDDERPKFNASLWADGELILWNMEMNEDGRSLTLDARQTRMLARLLRGHGVEA
jgi:DNA-binding transcriptional regulator PaaX